MLLMCAQCFDAGGWASGRACGLQKYDLRNQIVSLATFGRFSLTCCGHRNRLVEDSRVTVLMLYKYHNLLRSVFGRIAQ